MSIHRVTVPVKDDGHGAKTLGYAIAVARSFGARIEILHCRPVAEDVLDTSAIVPRIVREQIVESAHRLADQRENFVRRLLAEVSQNETVRHGDVPDITFKEVEGRLIDVIKLHGRLADLIVVPKPDQNRNLGANCLKSALFASGRPVLMCPNSENGSAHLAEHVGIGWNGSMQASRAVAMCIDIIQRATRVTVLSGGKDLHGASSEDLKRYLMDRGIETELVRFTAKGRAGRRLLTISQEIGADVLIAGAYHGRRDWESILGGDTLDLIQRAELPVIMVC